MILSRFVAVRPLTQKVSLLKATRVRLVLVGPDGDSVVAVSTGLGAARGNFISKMAGAEAAKDGIPSTRNSP